MGGLYKKIVRFKKTKEEEHIEETTYDSLYEAAKNNDVRECVLSIAILAKRETKGYYYKYAPGFKRNTINKLNKRKMEYSLTQDCRFGPKGKVVGYTVYHYDATPEERKTLFKEVGGVNASRTVTSSYNSADSHQFRDDVSEWVDGDATSSVSSSPSREEDEPLRYGGGEFGGGGASSDWGSSSDSSSDYSSSDSGSSDCGGGSDD